MTKIVVDAATRSKLRNLAEEMEFTDEMGRVITSSLLGPRESSGSRVLVQRNSIGGSEKVAADH